MNKNLEAKLFDKYPKIFRQKDLPMQQTCMCCGITCGDGWYTIIDRLCHQIQWHVKYNLNSNGVEGIADVEAVQVKEKFGGLRFYYGGGDEFIHGLVSMAEEMSNCTCEECGSPGTQNEGGWINTFCEPCREKHENR